MNNFIEIKRARVHNLKNLSVNIPHGKLVVITGVSGSGKSSLAFDTVYAEGQRRFIESMSSYARQFLGKLNKPEADYIKGIAPSIAIQQKVITNNPRSTVGTTTEIYDYLKLLFARIGKTYSPKSGGEVKKHTTTDVINYLKTLPENSKIAVLCPIDCDLKKLDVIYKQGFTRVYYDEQFYLIEDLKELNHSDELYLVVDRISTNFSDEDNFSRTTDSVSIAFTEGKGNCGILHENNIEWFNNRFAY